MSSPLSVTVDLAAVLDLANEGLSRDKLRAHDEPAPDLSQRAQDLCDCITQELLPSALSDGLMQFVPLSGMRRLYGYSPSLTALLSEQRYNDDLAVAELVANAITAVPSVDVDGRCVWLEARVERFNISHGSTGFNLVVTLCSRLLA